MRELGLLATVLHGFDERHLLQNVREQGITAVFCHNDWLALRAIRCFASAGLRVPQDVSVLGVDDSPTFVALCPDITTLHYPAESIGQRLRQILSGEANAGGPVEAMYVVERSTVAPYASAW